MFEWKVEEMKLMNDRKRNYDGKVIFSFERDICTEDKIQFVDSMNNGELTYILELSKKFKKDREELPKDSWGNVKTVSLKAWLKRNDTKHKCDTSYHYGEIYFLGCRRHINYIGEKNYYETFDDYVDEIFHIQLERCLEKEKRYFLDHDEYSILKRKFEERKHNTTFGVHIKSWSSGKMCVADDNGNEREITIEELKYLLSKYEELDRVVEKITAETNIRY